MMGVNAQGGDFGGEAWDADGELTDERPKPMIESHLAAYPMRLTFHRQEIVGGTARAALLGRESVGEDSFTLRFP